MTNQEATEKVIPRNMFPTPPQTDRSLFYIQRSKNTNAIKYDANVMADGKLNPAEPVSVYWIRYATDSTSAELTYIQRKYAYGVKTVPVPGKQDQFIVSFVSYEKKKFYVLRDPDGKKYRAFTNINGKMAELKKIFIQLSGGTFWFPNIVDIEISGKDPATHQNVVEHFRP